MKRYLYSLISYPAHILSFIAWLHITCSSVFLIPVRANGLWRERICLQQIQCLHRNSTAVSWIAWIALCIVESIWYWDVLQSLVGFALVFLNIRTGAVAVRSVTSLF